jgi:hypothetical protein
MSSWSVAKDLLFGAWPLGRLQNPTCDYFELITGFVSSFKFGSCWNGLSSEFWVLSVGEFVFAMLARKMFQLFPLFIRQETGVRRQETVILNSAKNCFICK